MLQLSLIRHAKSDWTFEAEDFYRPLNNRGHKDAPLMAQRLLDLGITPSLLVVSPAVRTYTTAQYFLEKFHSSNLLLNTGLYEAFPADFLHILCTLPEEHKAVGIIAHNPCITQIINYLTGESITNLPTCGIAVIQFDLPSWAYCSGETGTLLHFLSPKD